MFRALRGAEPCRVTHFAMSVEDYQDERRYPGAPGSSVAPWQIFPWDIVIQGGPGAPASRQGAEAADEESPPRYSPGKPGSRLSWSLPLC